MKIKISCKDCESEGEISLDLDETSLNCKEDFNLTQPCPLCEGVFGAPAGLYEQGDSGFLIRVGDAK